MFNQFWSYDQNDEPSMREVNTAQAPEQVMACARWVRLHSGSPSQPALVSRDIGKRREEEYARKWKIESYEARYKDVLAVAQTDHLHLARIFGSMR